MKRRHLKNWVEKTIMAVVAFLGIMLISVNDFTSWVGVVIYILAAIVCVALAKVLYKYGHISC